MNRQMEILTWIYQEKHPSQLPINTGNLYEEYEQENRYKGSKSAFSKLVRKLKAKGLLENPNYGEYSLTERGEKKAQHLLGETTEASLDKPDNYVQVVERLEDYFLRFKDEEINNQLVRNGELDISLAEIDSKDSMIIDWFEENPEEFINCLEESLEVYDASEKISFNIVPDATHLERDIADVKSSQNLDKLCVVEGIVKKSESIKHKIRSAVFECSQCGGTVEKEQDSSKLKSPYKCDCGSRKFQPIEKDFVDSIEVQISSKNDTDTTIDAYFDNSNLDKENQKDLISGRRLRVIGVLKEKPLSKKSKKFKPVLKIIGYESLDRQKKEEQFDQKDIERVRNKIKNSDNAFNDFALSLAPHLGDLELPKKCVAASLIGSPRRETEDEIDYGRIHVGIIANPGLGKSALLNWINENTNNSFVATGERGSGTGLTASVEKTEGGQWELVAGKAVFADQGILGVDEFDKFDEGELVKLNSAMQRGKISVDLATTQAELNARSTIIAAGNFKHPPGDYEEAKELLPEKGQGLYDRFALICGVTDQDTDKVHDSMASRYVKEDEDLETTQKDIVFEDDEIVIFRKLAKETDPYLTMECYKKLKNFADASKDKGDSSEEGSSNRFLQHLIKLTLCFARANLREETEGEDAVNAIKLMRESRESLGFEMGDPSFEVWDKNRIKKMKDVIKENYNGEDMAHIQDVVEDAKLPESKIEEIIDKLDRQGEIYNPKDGYVALT